jgi:hypothetical protein
MLMSGTPADNDDLSTPPERNFDILRRGVTG